MSALGLQRHCCAAGRRARSGSPAYASRDRFWRENAEQLWRRRRLAIVVIAVYVLIALLDSISWVDAASEANALTSGKPRTIIDRIFQPETFKEASYSAPLAKRGVLRRPAARPPRRASPRHRPARPRRRLSHAQGCARRPADRWADQPGRHPHRAAVRRVGRLLGPPHRRRRVLRHDGAGLRALPAAADRAHHGAWQGHRAGVRGARA